MKDVVDLKELVKTKKAKRVNSRTKGNSFERKIANILNEALGTTEFCRSPGSGAFATVHKLPDHLQLGGDLLTPKDFPFVIECKKGYQFKIAELLDSKSQFREILDKINKEASKHFKEPLLIFQQDRKQILCVVMSHRVEEHKDTVNIHIEDMDYTILSLDRLLTIIKSYYKT
jgi:Holliday junction resolvase